VCIGIDLTIMQAERAAMAEGALAAAEAALRAKVRRATATAKGSPARSLVHWRVLSGANCFACAGLARNVARPMLLVPPTSSTPSVACCAKLTSARP
jgi:hypothetical protein